MREDIRQELWKIECAKMGAWDATTRRAIDQYRQFREMPAEQLLSIYQHIAQWESRRFGKAEIDTDEFLILITCAICAFFVIFAILVGFAQGVINMLV